MTSDVFFFQAEDGIRDTSVTGVQTCALPICLRAERPREDRLHQGIRNDVDLRRAAARVLAHDLQLKPGRSEERRVGKECRSRWAPYQERKKEKRRWTFVSAFRRSAV